MSAVSTMLMLFSTLLYCSSRTPRRLETGVEPESSGSCPSSISAKERRVNITTQVRHILEDDIIPAFSCDLGTCQKNPALSCSHVYSNSSINSPGYYWLRRCDGSTFRAYCLKDSPCGCSERNNGWKRIAFLNTTDTSQPCPGGTRQFSQSQPIRTCARVTHGCMSLVYNTDYMPYQHVCGQVIGFQYRSPDAFSPYYEDRSKTIDDNYMDGVSITYGHFPRRHIWTLTAGLDETRTDFRRCPCANRYQTYDGVIPPFVGSDYFCETGSRSAVGTDFYSADPLWDGEGCGAVSTCCTSTTAPWFCKTLPEISRENVEVRLCGDEDNNNENIPIQLIELYVQ